MFYLVTGRLQKRANLVIFERSEIIVQQINAGTGSYASAISFAAYIIDTDFEVTKANLRKFFRSFIPTDIEAYLKDLLIPQFRATLTLSAGLEFPRSIDTGCLKNIAA